MVGSRGRSRVDATVSDQMLIVLRISLLALVYLTFFRVLRAVWVELRAEGPRPLTVPAVVGAVVPVPAPVVNTPTVAPGISGEARLVGVAPPSLAGTVFTLGTETTIGRASGCAVVIDDARVSKLHARVFFAAGRWVVEDLGSTNGTICNGLPLGGAQVIQSADRIQIADVVLEFV